MNPQDARTLAENFNKPIIEEQIKAEPLEKIFEAIKNSAAQGYYIMDYGLPFKVHNATANYYKDELIKRGYRVDMIIDRDKKPADYTLRIDWTK